MLSRSVDNNESEEIEFPGSKNNKKVEMNANHNEVFSCKSAMQLSYIHFQVDVIPNWIFLVRFLFLLKPGHYFFVCLGIHLKHILSFTVSSFSAQVVFRGFDRDDLTFFSALANAGAELHNITEGKAQINVHSKFKVKRA